MNISCRLNQWKTLWDRVYFSESTRSWFLADRDQFLYQCLHLYKHGTFNAVLARHPIAMISFSNR